MRKYHHLIFATICCLLLLGNHEADAQLKETSKCLLFLNDSVFKNEIYPRFSLEILKGKILALYIAVVPIANVCPWIFVVWT